MEQKLSQTVSEVAKLTKLLKEQRSDTSSKSQQAEKIQNLTSEIDQLKGELETTQSELQKSNSKVANLTKSETAVKEKLEQSYDTIQLLKNDVQKLVLEKAEINDQLTSVLGDATVIIENEKDDAATPSNDNRKQTESTQNAYSEVPEQYRGSEFYISKVNTNLEEVIFVNNFITHGVRRSPAPKLVNPNTSVFESAIR